MKQDLKTWGRFIYYGNKTSNPFVPQSLGGPCSTNTYFLSFLSRSSKVHFVKPYYHDCLPLENKKIMNNAKDTENFTNTLHNS